MRYSFTNEQQQLRDTVQNFLSEVSTTSAIRAEMDSERGFDAQVWNRLHNELGIGGIHVSSVYGGAGLSFVELAIVLEEMGRALFCSPYLSSCVFATSAIERLGTDEQKGKYLPELVTGRKIGTVAQYENSGIFEPDRINAAVEDGKLTTTKTLVTDAGVADTLLILAKNGQDGPPAFFIVDLNDSNVQCRSLETVDWTRKLSEVTFNKTPVKLLGETNPSSDALSYLFNVGIAALANEMVGGASRLLDTAIEYSKNRVQFGRSISSLQAIKHKCADLLLEVEFAKSAAYRAAHAITDQDPEMSQYCSLAKAVANDAYLKAGQECIQIHGGIGFTWENDTHLWFKRAKSSEVFLGNTAYHRERYLAEMGH